VTPEAAGRGETILVVDDDARLLEVLVDILLEEGYRVLTAGDGEQALALEGAHAEGIDLLLTDVLMPRMNGVDLWARFRDRRPQARVLFMSGYADGTALGATGTVLRKPCDRETLCGAVQAALGGSRGE
jgi:CheY-like chemotaxis protein